MFIDIFGSNSICIYDVHMIGTHKSTKKQIYVLSSIFIFSMLFLNYYFPKLFERKTSKNPNCLLLVYMYKTWYVFLCGCDVANFHKLLIAETLRSHLYGILYRKNR